MVKEKRRERRLKVRLPIAINYPDNPPISSQTENISRLGTYVEVEQEIPMGVHLDITIEIPAYTNALSLTGEVKCRGDVFRCNLAREVESKKIYGLGIFFTTFLSDEDRDKLSKYIDFLILKEQEDIKQAVQRWRGRRRKQQG
jgi:hypothetical protein